MKIVWKGSPNFTAGRGGKKVEMIVCHWIVGTLASATNTFASATRKASSHYGVGQSEVHQYVKEADTAWHAGVFDINQRSIGIEHEGGPDRPITDAVYKNSAELIAGIWKRFGRVPLRAHKEFKATQCPGTLDLKRLEREALAIFAPPPVDPCLTVKNDLVKAKATIVEKDNIIKTLSERLAIAENKPAKEIIKEVIKTVEVEPSWLQRIKDYFRSLNV